MRFLLLAVTAVLSCGADAANTASGRNWRLAIESLECQGALLVLGARIGYLGPHGPVEAPLIRVVDAQGMPTPALGVSPRHGSGRKPGCSLPIFRSTATAPIRSGYGSDRNCRISHALKR